MGGGGGGWALDAAVGLECHLSGERGQKPGGEAASTSKFNERNKLIS